MASHIPDYQPLTSDHDAKGGNPHQRRKSRILRTATAALLLLPTFVVLALLLALCLLGIKFSDTDEHYGCDPEGNVWVQTPPNLWSHSYGLAITLGFGKFHFSAVKLVDACWDLVVGRGGQVLAGGLVYYIFRGPVIAMMRHDAVPYEKVLKMQYHPGGTTSFFTYVKDVHWKGRSTAQWLDALIMAITTLYVLSWPTWTSTMTGYQPINIPLLTLNERSTYIAFSDLARCVYVVRDGTRIGLGSDVCVNLDSKFYTPVRDYIAKYVTYDFTNGWTGNAHPASASDIPSTLNFPDRASIHLSSPLLNITKNDFSKSMHSIHYDGRSFTISDLTQMGVCAPQKVYRWGFSLILLFMFLSVTWLLAIFVNIVNVRYALRASDCPEPSDMIFGGLRTPLAVARSVRGELGDEMCERLSERELSKWLKVRSAGMRLTSPKRSEPGVYQLRDIRLVPSAQGSQASSSQRTADTAGLSPRHVRHTGERSF